MADLTLVKSYLREAALDSRTTAAAQLAWLETQRAALHKEVSEGDWAINATSFEGASSSGQRALNANTRLAAVLAAIERLEESSGIAISPTRGGCLIARLAGGLHS